MQKSNGFFLSPLLQSLGVFHGFTTRQEGTSTNAGLSLQSLCQVKQVHGHRVISLQQAEQDLQEADGMISSMPLLLSVKVADCVPILLSNGHGVVSAIHAGWRGTVANIAKEAVECFSQYGTHASKIFAAFGPSIGPCCFLVGAEVAEAFFPMGKEVVFQDHAGQYRVNLWAANRQWLVHAGVKANHIDKDPLCTSCHPELFFSHRRDKGITGRHLAFIQGGIAGGSIAENCIQTKCE